MLRLRSPNRSKRPAPIKPVHIGLHQDLQDRLGEAAQEVAVVGLLQRLDQCHSVVGLGVLSAQVEVRKLTLAVSLDGHPNPRQSGPRIYTSLVDANEAEDPVISLRRPHVHDLNQTLNVGSLDLNTIATPKS